MHTLLCGAEVFRRTHYCMCWPMKQLNYGVVDVVEDRYISQRIQISLRRLQDALKMSRRLITKQDVVTRSGKDVRFTSSWRRLIYNVFWTSDLRLLEDASITLSWRRRIWGVLKTSDLQRLQDVWFMASLRPPLYVVLKTSDLWRLEDICKMTSVYQRRSDVYATSKEMIFS